MELLTFGHGTAAESTLAELIRGAGIEHVVDVRSVPKSRQWPHVWSDKLAAWIPRLTGATYAWQPALGGFRKAKPDSRNTGLRNLSFRGYADYMETAEFTTALEGLIAEAAKRRTAVMCSESLWWRCHRRLIADRVEIVNGISVAHLGHNGRLTSHAPTDGVKRAGDTVQYRASSPP